MKILFSLPSFYSSGDEDRLMRWAIGIKGIRSLDITDCDAVLNINSRKLDEYDLRNLLSLFLRYGLPTCALRPLSEKRKFSFLDTPKSYWHNAVFGLGRKNIQVVDAVENRVDEFFEVSDKEFSILFPEGSDVVSIEDAGKLDDALGGIFKMPVHRLDLRGIHGTVFLGTSHSSHKAFNAVSMEGMEPLEPREGNPLSDIDLARQSSHDLGERLQFPLASFFPLLTRTCCSKGLQESRQFVMSVAFIAI